MPRSEFVEDGPWRAVHAEGKSLVLNQEAGQSLLFKASDALDQKPLEDESASTRMRSRLDQYLQLEEIRGTGAGPLQAAPAWTEEELRLLRSLG